ncbi:hypothetical protein L9F63_010648, partial [Diploptera punctata]
RTKAVGKAMSFILSYSCVYIVKALFRCTGTCTCSLKSKITFKCLTFTLLRFHQ